MKNCSIIPILTRKNSCCSICKKILEYQSRVVLSCDENGIVVVCHTECFEKENGGEVLDGRIDQDCRLGDPHVAT